MKEMKILSIGNDEFEIVDGKARLFNNVEEMKSCQNLTVDNIVQTAGFYNLGDGGSAIYKIVSTKDETKRDIEYISLKNGLYAEIIVRNNLYSKQLGIIGDGGTDETYLLNEFYKINTPVNKILNQGTYLVTSTIFIEGQWNKTITSDNSYNKFIFDKANIKYMGVENGCSILFYNLYRNEITGLSINRSSNLNYVDFVGCSLSTINQFDIRELGIRRNPLLVDSTKYKSQAIEHLNFSNGYVKGMLSIDPGTTYANQINFNNVNFNGTGADYCVNLLGAKSKHNICFNQCDLSLAAISVFNVDEEQTGNASIKSIECYFDSSIPMFSNHNQNKILYVSISDKFSSQSGKQINNIKLSDFLKNTSIGSDVYTGNSLPTILRNYAKNGDLGNAQESSQNRLLGISRTDIDTKTYKTNISGMHNNAQNIVATKDDLLYVDGVTNAPFEGKYTFAIRMKINSGTATRFQLGFGGEYVDYLFENLVIGEEIVLVHNKNQWKSVDDLLRGTIEFIGVDNLDVDIYEVVIIPGTQVFFGLPLKAPVNN